MSPSERNRAFHYALGASLLLHALLFLSVPNLLDGARRAVESIPQPLLARLSAPEPAPAPPAAVEKPAPQVEKPPAPPKKPPPKPVVRPVPRPEPVPAPPAAAPQPPAPVPETAPAPAASAPPAPPAPEPSVEAQAAARAAAQAAEARAQAEREARTIGEYRLELIEAARRIKDRTRYPPLARDNNWTGSALVGVAVAPQGAPASSVRASSGHAVLDEHALAIFRQATREVPVPPALRGKAFAVEVRMDFTLRD